MMYRKFVSAALVAGAVALSAGAAFAGAKDYVFEPVQAEMKQSDSATVAVRLVHKPTGKPVPGAVIIRTRLDMAPEGMAEHATTIKPEPASNEPGVYAFKADLSMTGRWQLSLAAKVSGEPETIVSKVVLKVSK
jgi:hypothetical protein